MLKGKLNIIHICSWYPNKLKPMDGNFVHKHIASTIHDVNAIAIAVYETRSSLKNTYSVDETEKDGVKSIIIYHRMRSFMILNILFRMYYYIKAFELARKKLGQVHLIHAHVTLFAGVFSYLQAFLTGIPYIISEHSTIYRQNNISSLKLWLARLAISKSRAFLPVSSDLNNTVRAFNIRSKHTVVPNVIDGKFFYPQEHEKTEKIKILHVSTLDDNTKNISGMLRVIQTVTHKRPNIQFQIIGERNIAKTKRMIDQLRIKEANLELLGPMCQEDISAYFRAADCFLLFSNHETFSVVLAEAWSCGIPAIYSNCGGLTNLDDPRLGVQVGKKDETAMVKAIFKVVDQLETYDPMFMHQYIQQQSGVETIRNKLLSLYRDCALPS
jgi:glycosyltransferase involved in cell wall biosynthesis